MTKKPDEHIENQPVIINILKLIGLVIAIATVAFTLGQYKANIDRSVSNVETDVQEIRIIAEGNRERLKSLDIETHLEYIRQAIDEIKSKLEGN